VRVDRLGELELEIGSVNRGFRDLVPDRVSQPSHHSCPVDTACSAADNHRDQVRSVGLYTNSGTRSCTGALLNNTSGDGTPYFLTARHCGFDDGVVAVERVRGGVDYGPRALEDLDDLALKFVSGETPDSLAVDIAYGFVDPDGDDLTYAASSSAETVAMVSVSDSTLTLTPVAVGTATVTATATDVRGSNTAAEQRFAVRVLPARAATLGYRIAVADTATGAVKEYVNEAGREAEVIADVAAFRDACQVPIP